MPQTVIIRGPEQRALIHSIVDKAHVGIIVTFKEQTRNNEQNARMWAMLSDISRAKPEERMWTTEVWKAAFMDFLGHEIQWQPGLSGTPIPVGYRTSKLTVKQMADLITVISEYGDRHGVHWSEPNPYGVTA
mgnify:FL=1|tara:strand:+ start:465 stop:860 length:396 start_codon:yes stop_codon:yes gene_type:complete